MERINTITKTNKKPQIYFKMRKLFSLAAMAALMLSSCSNDLEIDNPNEKKNSSNQISFRSFIDKGAVSRSTVTNSSNILGFTVSGWWDKTNDASGDITDPDDGGYLFNAYDITRREVSSGLDPWMYNDIVYWPSEGSGVDFFAYSPASSNNVKKGLHNYNGDPIQYAVPDPSRTVAQEDFLMARTERLDKEVVNLNFAHVLSRVRFYARTTNTRITYVIYDVQLVDISKEGTIKYSQIPTNGKFDYNDSDPTSTPVTLWNNLTNNGNLGIDIGESPIYLLGGSADPNKYYSLQGETNALMVLPQTTELGEVNSGVRSGFWIKVSYKAYLTIDGTYFAGSPTTTKDVYFQVTDKLRSVDGNSAPFSFEIGRQYNFCLEFGKEAEGAITFNPEVSGWDNAAPEVDLPQITDYFGAGLISETLAAIANPNYATKGVTLGDILGQTKIFIKDVAGADALKGLEYFTNLQALYLNNATDLVIDFTGLDKLTSVNLGLNVSFAKLDVSARKTLPLQIAAYIKTITDKNGSTSGTETENIVTTDKLIVWDGFVTSPSSSGAILSLTGHSGGNGKVGYHVINSIEAVAGGSTSESALAKTQTKYYK